MKPKNKVKLTVIIAIACLLALMSVITIIAIFAASNQNVLSNISVTYKAVGVNANVSAKYYVGEDESLDMTTNGTASGGKVLNFAIGKETNPNTLNPQGTIELTTKKSFVVFEYKFENLGIEFEANLSYTGTSENLLLFSAEQSTEPITEFSQIETSITSPEEFSLYSYINESEVKYVYLKVEVWKMEDDANFNGDFQWDLTLDLSNEIEKTFKITDLNDSYCIDGFQTGVTMQDLVIPEHYKGKPVTGISSNAFKTTNITSLTLPKTINDVTYTSSSSSATDDAFPISLNKIYFMGNLSFWCESPISNLNRLLTSVRNLYVNENGEYKLISDNLIIPDDVKVITAYKFYNRPITALTIGENVAKIESQSFDECKYITKINFNAIAVANMYYGGGTFKNFGSSKGLDLVFGNKVTRIPSCLFYSCSVTINNVTFGENIEYIGSEAFRCSYGLTVNATSIHIVKSISSIQSNAFYNWTSLNEVILDSERIYFDTESSYSNGDLLANLKSTTGKLKVLADIDNGNDYISSNFTQGEQEEIDGQMYHVYTKN